MSDVNIFIRVSHEFVVVEVLLLEKRFIVGAPYGMSVSIFIVDASIHLSLSLIRRVLYTPTADKHSSFWRLILQW